MFPFPNIQDRVATLEDGEGFLVEGLSNEDYHSADCPGVSNTGIGYLAKSYDHFLNYIQNRGKTSKEKSLGAAIHAALYEPEEFLKNVYELPPAAHAAFRKATKAINPNAIFLKKADLDGIPRLLRAAHQSNIFSSYMRSPDKLMEASIFFRYGSHILRSRPDSLNLSSQIIIDLKSTRDASPKPFMRSVAMYRYDVQAAIMRLAFRSISGGVNPKILLAAAETAPPHGFKLYQMEEKTLRRGNTALDDALRNWGVSGGYGQEVGLL